MSMSALSHRELVRMISALQEEIALTPHLSQKDRLRQRLAKLEAALPQAVFGSAHSIVPDVFPNFSGVRSSSESEQQHVAMRR